MSVQSWSPQSTVIEESFLRRCIKIAAQEQLEEVAQFLSAAEQQEQAGLMRLGPEAWEKAVTKFTDAEILHMIRFFTVAEMQLPGWQAGPKSPVIGLARVLRSRGCKLERELLLWIRSRSSNRYLPYGPVV